MSSDPTTQQTPLLNFSAGPIQSLIADRGWCKFEPAERAEAAYEFVRNEIAFGYNSDDTLPASDVLRDGFGQCNTKTTLLMALLRAMDLPCRFHGFTIHKSLQRGIVPEIVYPLAPTNILHSWVEVFLDGRWVTLEGFILDDAVLAALQRAFPDQDRICGYGAGTDNLHAPDVGWSGRDTYIQRTGINAELGTFASPDAFYAEHRQLRGVKGMLYKLVIRHWMNARVERLRRGLVPNIPKGPATALPPQQANVKEAV
ncbi:transglutaminase family protein [Yoonia sp. R2331]|uniref:transglutaminase-like domain-containing protein n=1 Tax=Yoonia sp. R2331 TaxID=3237238 RepID=UPI0034E3ACAD